MTSKLTAIVSRIVVPFIVLISPILFPLPSDSQEEALFSLRGTVTQSYTNFFTGNFEAQVHATQISSVAYTVVCPPSGFSSCPSTLAASTGSCANLNGVPSSVFISPPYNQEILYLDLIGYPANCTVHESVFRFTGHIISYTPPQTSPTGYAEFDIDADGMTYHSVCDPLYSGCNSAIYQAVTGSKCVTAVGDMESFIIGLFGDTTVINWTTHLYVSGSGAC